MMKGKFAKLSQVLVLGLIGGAVLMGSYPVTGVCEVCCCGPVGQCTIECPIATGVVCEPYEYEPNGMVCTGWASGGIPPYTPYWNTDGEWEAGPWTMVVHTDRFGFGVIDAENRDSCWLGDPCECEGGVNAEP